MRVGRFVLGCARVHQTHQQESTLMLGQDELQTAEAAVRVRLDGLEPGSDQQSLPHCHRTRFPLLAPHTPCPALTPALAHLPRQATHYGPSLLRACSCAAPPRPRSRHPSTSLCCSWCRSRSHSPSSPHTHSYSMPHSYSSPSPSRTLLPHYCPRRFRHRFRRGITSRHRSG